MNIVCDKVLLSAAIDGVSKAVTMRSAIPVLEGILLKAEGFQLTLTGYDLEMGIVTTIEANVKEPGEIVLNAKLLSSMISRMPAGQITIQSADNGKTTIQSGVAQFEIQSMSATDFPELPNTGAEETLTIPTGVLRDMIDRTLYAVSQDEKKPAHTGELFEIEPDKLTIVALDGYRLAIVERPVTAVKDIRIIENQMAQQQIEASKVSVNGCIELALQDNKGQVRRLSDLKGKVVLLDFHLFASKESTKRIMMLRELYNKYHAAGLEIYQVSVDPDEHFWKTSTAAIPWICVRDEDGIQGKSLTLYNVQSIPTFFLIDRTNTLQARDAQIKDIEAAIKNLL